MKILYLRISRTFFEAIKSGEKTEESRDVYKSNVSKFYKTNAQRVIFENGLPVPREYDVIEFMCGSMRHRSQIVSMKCDYWGEKGKFYVDGAPVGYIEYTIK